MLPGRVTLLRCYAGFPSPLRCLALGIDCIWGLGPCACLVSLGLFWSLWVSLVSLGLSPRWVSTSSRWGSALSTSGRPAAHKNVDPAPPLPVQIVLVLPVQPVQPFQPFQPSSLLSSAPSQPRGTLTGSCIRSALWSTTACPTTTTTTILLRSLSLDLSPFLSHHSLALTAAAAFAGVVLVAGALCCALLCGAALLLESC